jgi:hypothetical protein
VGQSCPAGFERIGGLSQAAACVELARRSDVDNDE